MMNRHSERTYNFFRPVGQIIEHVDTINFSMEKDGTFHFENVGQVNDMGAKHITPTAFRGKDEQSCEALSMDGSVRPQQESVELNYFAPKKIIADLLCQNWFDEVCSDIDKYTTTWREKMVEALMESEYGEGIAREWAEPDKRLQVKCAFVGALKDAGVIKGSYNALAPQLGIMKVAHASLAKYMGYGKKQPYFDWLKQYV